jgi:hypothetical protein
MIVILGIFLCIIVILIYYIYNQYVIDYNYNFETFCKDSFCARIMEKESLETIYKLYDFYNELINILPQEDIRTKKLLRRYDIKKGLFEVDPFNKKKYTSYTLNKNSIGMCMRERNIQKKIHDLEILKFVFLHEVAHICTESYEHTEDFWENFRWLLTIVYKNKLMQPLNFGKNPVSFCGILIDNNPYFNF